MKLTAEQQKLVEENLRLAYWFSRRWRRRFPADFADREDADQLAMLGLCEAAATYDAGKAAAFGTWAFKKMLGQLTNATCKAKYRSTVGRRRLWTPFGQLLYTQIGTWKHWEHGDSGGERLHEHIGVKEYVHEPATHDKRGLDDREYAEAALKLLRPKTRDFVRRIGAGQNSVEIAAECGCSPQNVRECLLNARNKVRAAMRAA